MTITLTDSQSDDNNIDRLTTDKGMTITLTDSQSDDNNIDRLTK